MAQTFQTRIEDLVGEAAGGDLSLTTNMLQDMFDAGIRAIIRGLPANAIEFASKKTTFAPTSGTQVKNPKILKVLRNDGTYNRECTEMDLANAGTASEHGSFYEPSARWPVYFLEPQASGFVLVKILPTSATSTAGILYHMAIPPIAIGDSTIIAGFPEELEELPVFYAAGLALMRESGVTRRLSQDQVEASIVAMAAYIAGQPTLVLPAVPDVQTLTYTTAGAEPSSTITITPSIPTYEGPTSVPIVETEITDALTKAKTLIDAGGSAGGDAAAADLSFQTALIAKHLDYARTSLAGAAQEVSRASAHLQTEQLKFSEFSNKTSTYLQKFQNEISARNSEVQEQTSEVNAGISAYGAKAQDNAASFTALADQYRQDLQRYSSEVTAKVQGFQSETALNAGFLTEAQSRFGAASSYDGKAAVAWQAGKDYIQHARDEMSSYKGEKKG